MKERALEFCKQKHAGQVRKYTGEPYWKHPEEVAMLVAAFSDSEAMYIAALLHDTIEDTDTTKEEIQEIFGSEVAELVDELTNKFKDKSIGNRAKRKALEADRISKISRNAKTIKLADLISNSRSIVERDPDFAKVYMEEKKAVLEGLQDGDPTLCAMANSIIRAYFLSQK